MNPNPTQSYSPAALAEDRAHLETLLQELKPVAGWPRVHALDSAIGAVEVGLLSTLEAQILALFPHDGNELIIAQRERPRAKRLPATEARRWHRRATRRRPLSDATRVILWRVAAGHLLALALGLGLGAGAVGRRRSCTR